MPSATPRSRSKAASSPPSRPAVGPPCSATTRRRPCGGSCRGRSATPRSRCSAPRLRRTPACASAAPPAPPPPPARPPRPPPPLCLDDTPRHHGIPVTTPARTLLDLAATLDHRPLRAATRRAQSLHRDNVRQLAEPLARHRSRRGAARLAEVIATGPAPSKSELQDVVLDLILRGGHVHPDVNVP